jgi:hypothetical protein
MAYFPADTVARWIADAERYLIDNHGITRAGIKTGVDAWSIAHRCGITQEAYADRKVTDGHIQTALERVFPAAVFRDRKVY